jgi:endonuclease-3
MDLKERYRRTIEYFQEHGPVPETELEYRDPFELIVAVILSAQCTDKRVNLITPPLLRAFPDADSMSAARHEEIFEYIKSCSYPNNKTKHLIGMAKMLKEKFGGIVPDDPEVLQQLPGVGRKTAYVVASVIYRKPVMAVDTHVFRVSKRIGLSPSAKTPLDVERTLTTYIKPELMHNAHHWLILHGRYVCRSKNPLCSSCGLADFCTYFNEKKRSGKND